MLEEKVNQLETDPLTAYLRQINQYKLLTKEKEIDISKRMADTNEEIYNLEDQFDDGEINEFELEERTNLLKEQLEQLKTRMVTSNLRLVVSIAKKFQHRGLSLIDLISEGNIGLLEAVERFDYKRNCRFSTYGIWWIQQAIKKALADKGRIIRIPVHVLNTIKKSHAAAKHLTQELGSNPTIEQIADYLNLPPEKIEKLMAVATEPASLDSPVDQSHVTTLEELIFSENYREPFDTTFRESAKDIINESFEHLNEREKSVLKMRFGLMGKEALTLETIGEELGITRERVRQIQNTAIFKLSKVDYIQQLKNLI